MIVLLFFWGMFANIITYLVFMDGLFMLIIGVGIMVLRKTRPNADRPYRTLGYPVTPILFILISLFFTLATLIAKPVQALAAFGCMLAGVPFYVYFRKRNKNQNSLKAIDLT